MDAGPDLRGEPAARVGDAGAAGVLRDGRAGLDAGGVRRGGVGGGAVGLPEWFGVRFSGQLRRPARVEELWRRRRWRW